MLFICIFCSFNMVTRMQTWIGAGGLVEGWMDWCGWASGGMDGLVEEVVVFF